MLDESQLAALCALADRLIPPDDHPGAVQAGAVDYLVLQLGRDLAPLLESYRSALAALDAEARAASGRGFAELAPETQDELLRRVARGDVAAPWPTGVVHSSATAAMQTIPTATSPLRTNAVRAPKSMIRLANTTGTPSP